MTSPEIEPEHVARLLDIGRELIVQQFDAAVVLKLFDSIPTSDLDMQTRGAIRHARLLALDVAGGGISHMAVARFALMRVITLVEQHIEGSVEF